MVHGILISMGSEGCTCNFVIHSTSHAAVLSELLTIVIVEVAGNGDLVLCSL